MSATQNLPAQTAIEVVEGRTQQATNNTNESENKHLQKVIP